MKKSVAVRLVFAGLLLVGGSVVGENRVFLGDSITHGGATTGFMQLYWSLRHPGDDVRFWNCGRSGGQADSGLKMIDAEFGAINPAKVYVMFGMNDVWRQQWESAEPGEEEARLRGDAIRRYTQRMAAIAEKLGDRMVVLTPTPYDQYGNVEGCPATPYCNEPGLATCAQIVRDLAASNRLQVVDFHAKLTAAMKAQPEARFGGEDRVHPRPWGHHVMTAILVSELGEPAEFSKVERKAGPEGVDFTYSPKALPFPMSADYRAAEAFYPITPLFNRETLRVTDLAAGEWELRMGDRLVGVFSAGEFAKGVNLAVLDTPNQRVAQAAKIKADRLNQIYCIFRDCIMGAREKPGATGYGAYLLRVYEENGDKLDELHAEADRIVDELHAIRPVSCRLQVCRRSKALPPVNLFCGLGNADFEDDGTNALRLIQAIATNTPCDFVTFTLRCKPDLNDPRVKDIFRRVAEACHVNCIRIAMDTDPRIARAEFLRRWPDDRTQLVSFDPGYRPNLTDHMTGGTRGYEIETEAVFDEASGAKVYGLYNCDVFSPHLLPYVEELMRTYRDLGADSAMRDEWGEPPCYDPAFASNKVFWYSKAMADTYRTYSGRDLKSDIVLMGTAPAGKEVERLQAVYKYNELLFLRNTEIERHHYAKTKELFGHDAYVTKHPTWWPAICPAEFHHNGLDWWSADRDYAQTDELTPLSARLGMMKKFGGSTWMNEGYQDAPEKYLPEVKRYLLSGGRMVFHPVYGGDWGKGLSPQEYKIASMMSIFNQPGMKDAMTQVRKAGRQSSAQLDSPVAFVFGHFEVMNWENAAAYRDWGADVARGLYAQGWAVDAYPSTELVAGTFRVDSEGWLRVGHQRYRALVVRHLSDLCLRQVRATLSAPGVKTKLYEGKDDGVLIAEVARDLESVGAVRQPPLVEARAFGRDKSFFPGTSGVMTLQDGQKIEVK